MIKSQGNLVDQSELEFQGSFEAVAIDSVVQRNLDFGRSRSIVDVAEGSYDRNDRRV